MVKSFRGKEVDMLALERANAEKIALGNAHMNTKGDIVGRGGVIIKTREEQLKEWSSRVIEETPITFKDEEENQKIESELKELAPKPIKTKTNKPKVGKIIYDDITEEEIKKVDENTEGQ